MSSGKKPVKHAPAKSNQSRLAGKGYKAQLRLKDQQIQELIEGINLAAFERKVAVSAGNKMRDIIQLIVEMADDAHGYRLKCGCDDCKAITETLKDLAQHDIIKLPKLDDSLIVQV